MKTLRRFVSSHPILFPCIVTSTISAAVVELCLLDILYSALGEPLDSFIIGFHVLLVVCIPMMLWNLERLYRISSVMLLGALLMSGVTLRAQQPAEPLPLVIIGGVCIIGLGSFVGCRAYKKCAKIAAARTNSWPAELGFHPAGADNYAANFSWSEEGYCIAQKQTAASVPVSFTLSITVESTTNTIVTVTAISGDSYAQDWSSFCSELAADGLAMTSGPPLESYSRNLQPVFAEQVPISIDWRTHTVRLGGGDVRIAVDRSDDLRIWAPLMTINAPVGSRLLVEDVAESPAQFYRVSIR